MGQGVARPGDEGIALGFDAAECLAKADHESVHAAVPDQQVGAAPDVVDVVSVFPRQADGEAKLLFVLGKKQYLRRPAHAKGGVRRHGLVL